MRLDDLVWRQAYDAPSRFADWVRELGNRSGVYLVRDAQDGELLYIGMSAAYTDGQGNRGLYRTLTRHLHGHGWKLGLTYEASDVEIAVIVTETTEQASQLETELLATYGTRDNQLTMELRGIWLFSEEEEHVPF